MTIADPRGVSGSPYYRQQVDVFECQSAVAANELCALIMTSDENLLVAPADTDTHDPAVKVVAALEAGAAGDFIRCVVGGPALINTPATGPSVSEVLILTSAAGVGDGLAADATTVEGDAHGVFLSDEVGSTNQSWVWIYY